MQQAPTCGEEPVDFLPAPRFKVVSRQLPDVELPKRRRFRSVDHDSLRRFLCDSVLDGRHCWHRIVDRKLQRYRLSCEAGGHRTPQLN